MAENDLTEEEQETRRQRRRAAMATPVADEGDVAFGAMAGIALLAAIITATFAFLGFGQPPQSSALAATEQIVAPPATDPIVADSLDTQQIIGALGAAGFNGISLTDDGGVVTATGVVADEDARTKVLALIAEQPFVTGVVDGLSIDAAEVTEVGPAAAVVTATDDAIVLSGTVPSEETAQALRDLAAANYEASQITDELQVLDGADPASLTINGTLADGVRASALSTGVNSLVGVSITDNLASEEVVDASEEINEVLELDPILFQSGTAVILPESQGTLDEAIRILGAFPSSNIEIGGHTDSLGEEGANQALSQQRADAVLQALRDGGVTNQLSAVGYGETQLLFPDDKGDTPDKVEARQANRRIEFRTL